jgi:hypothetical protein
MPAEFTTMAGRRLREAVYHTVKKAWGQNVVVSRGRPRCWSSQ